MVSFTSKDIPDLKNQVILVTGGNIGLGLETIHQLGLHNPARIYLAARSQERADAAIKHLRRENEQICPIIFLKLDLASFGSIKQAATEFLKRETRLDVLVNNAGIMMTAAGLTEEGYEIQFGTNMMGHALLTQLLLPTIQETAKLNAQARIVMVASAAHARAPADVYKFNELRTTASNRATTQRYTTSKLANIHYAKALSKRVKGLKIIAVHPGMVATNLHKASTGIFLRPFLYTAGFLFATPVDKGALSQIWAAVSPEACSGQYYGPVGRAEQGSKLSQDENLQEELYRWIQNELKGHADVVL